WCFWLAPEALFHFEPGASPQEFGRPQQPLKARLIYRIGKQMNRAFSAGRSRLLSPEASPQARDESAPLALHANQPGGRPRIAALVCARSRAIVPLPGSCFLPGSFPAAHSHKQRRTVREPLDL